MYRGFTVVEVLVVIVVLAILATILTGSYIQYEQRAQDSEAQSLAASVRSSAERYFNRNGEYPSAADLAGITGTTDPTGAVPANYDAAKSYLELTTSILSSDTIRLLPCANLTSTTCVPSPPDTTKVYYLTKRNADGTAVRSYSILSKPTGGTSCTYTFPSGEGVRNAFILAFWSYKSDVWQVVRSSNGTVNTSSTASCPFRAL